MNSPKKRGRPPKQIVKDPQPEIQVSEGVKVIQPNRKCAVFVTEPQPITVTSVTEPSEPISISILQPKLGATYDYKMLYATGGAVTGMNWEKKFDELGKEGYLFIGESVGRSIFVKPIS